MTPFEIAQGYIGTTEGPGPEDNPAIIEMYASVGHDWVEHDAVAWCAAFVGHCLEKAGLRSTRRLNARSYLDWGIPIDLADAQPGDIVVFSRGSKSWQGHVGFFVKATGTMIEVLGGNQSDAVTIQRYAKSRLLGVRRAGNVAPAVTLSVREVQARLKALGYHEVGQVDGEIGPRTRAAILAFRDDHGLPLVPIIDVALTEALTTAGSRQVAAERAAGVPEGSRIITAANAQVGLGVLGAAGSVAAQIAPALVQAEEARDTAERVLDLVGLTGVVQAALPWIGAAVFTGVIFYALKARNARIEDHRSGKTP
ncbi:C40 family peptidase [Thalassobacter stenotrophicus]|uniref:Spore cortex-lytic enzyme n=2 Tax=Thalassobacter stenotrophicus TaxID=266809 RepID=A0A0P1FCW2_9RHOB|nr:TIGR02594 family protein [Thalassobacter stenotrophicus]CUH59037.1 spore cortex-lytic enzyme [Thalassobacter stenotrophicus]SHJ03113.1 TIGR02594 family protein [Thalassobacter stenotrophicus DSM 16310]